jgi:hypothetical protein
MPGKTPMWGNPMREREILLFSFRKVHNNNNNTFPAKRKTTYNTKTVPHKSALKIMPQSVQLYGFVEYWHLKICATTGSCTLPLVNRPPSENSSRTALKIVPTLALVFMPQICCCTTCMDPYSTPVPINNTTTNQNKKCLLGICALALLGIMPFLLLSFLSQAYSEISHAPPLNVSCTLPNAFFYKYENDIFPPKCLFTFPNPKSKGQD